MHVIYSLVPSTSLVRGSRLRDNCGGEHFETGKAWSETSREVDVGTILEHALKIVTAGSAKQRSVYARSTRVLQRLSTVTPAWQPYEFAKVRYSVEMRISHARILQRLSTVTPAAV